MQQSRRSSIWSLPLDAGLPLLESFSQTSAGQESSDLRTIAASFLAPLTSKIHASAYAWIAVDTKAVLVVAESVPKKSTTGARLGGLPDRLLHCGISVASAAKFMADMGHEQIGSG
jgi:hypothetical protein